LSINTGKTTKQPFQTSIFIGWLFCGDYTSQQYVVCDEEEKGVVRRLTLSRYLDAWILPTSAIFNSIVNQFANFIVLTAASLGCICLSTLNYKV